MYRKAIVTFIDILGFRDLVKGSSASALGEKVRAVAKYALPKSSSGYDENQDVFGIQFSDSVVRVRKIDEGAGADEKVAAFFMEASSLVHAQADLASVGILMRGGIAFGDVSIGHNIVYGPAFIAAYDLESKFANYPRIVVSPDLISEIKINENRNPASVDISEELDITKRRLRRGDDGIWFIDYFRSIYAEMDDDREYVDFMDRHKELIVNGAKEFKKFDATLAKYLWLANYHNTCVKELSSSYLRSLKKTKKSLAIDKNHIAALQGFEL